MKMDIMKLIKSSLKIISLILFCSIVIFYSVKLGMNYTGYCFSQKRYLTDVEKIDSVVQNVISSYPPTFVYHEKEESGNIVDKWVTPENPIYYKSNKEFFAVNRDCCVVTDTVKRDTNDVGENISMVSKLSGSISDYVRVRYLVRYINTEGSLVEEHYESYYAISNCGYVWSGI